MISRIPIYPMKQYNVPLLYKQLFPGNYTYLKLYKKINTACFILDAIPFSF